MESQKKVLKNGLRTIFIDAKGSPSASVQIWFQAGSSLETKENSGIAHFLEHMFFKGTKKRPGAKIAHDVESFGGEINAFTSFDYTCYYINTPNNHIVETADILMDMISNPSFLTSEILPEKEVVFEEYRRSQDSPNQFSFQKIQKNSFLGPYSRPILGREETIKNFTKEDLNFFRKNFYNLQTAFLVVAGDLSLHLNKVTKKIEEYKLPKGKDIHLPSFKLKNKATLDVHRKEVRMSQLTLSISASSLRSDLAPAADLAFSVFGSGESSILNRKLVLEKSLANSSSSSTMFFNEGGVHFLRLTFPPSHLKKVLEKLASVIKKSRVEGFSEADVSKIKNQYIASKIYDKESLESFAFSLGHSMAQTNDLLFEDKYIEKIKSVPLEKVHEVFNDIFNLPLHLSLQVPLEEDISNSKLLLEKFSEEVKSHEKKLIKKKEKSDYVTFDFDSQLRLSSLGKGIRLLYRYNSLTPTFVLHAYLNGGLASESIENNGISNLLSSLLIKGYKGISHDELRSELDTFSASLNGFSGKNAYGLTLHGQTEHASPLFKHFFSSLLIPSFEEKHFKHEREINKRTLEIQKEDPIKVCFKRVSEIMFGTHPYSYNSSGSLNSLEKITLDQIKDFHSKKLNESEILFTYCGDLSFEKVKEKVLEGLKLFPVSQRKIKKHSAQKVSPEKLKKEFIYFDREQTQIFYGLTCKGMKDSYGPYFKMLTSHLSGQSSKLFVDVRDRKGLCYTAAPLYMNALDGGYWGIYMASGHDKVLPAVMAIKDLLKEIQDKGLSKKEFERLKLMIEGQNLVNIQTNEDYANIYSVSTFQNLGTDFFKKNNDLISQMKYEDFQEKIMKILKKEKVLVLVGREDISI